MPEVDHDETLYNRSSLTTVITAWKWVQLYLS